MNTPALIYSVGILIAVVHMALQYRQDFAKIVTTFSKATPLGVMSFLALGLSMLGLGAVRLKRK